MDQEGMSIRHRGPPIDASYQVSVHLAKQFQIKSAHSVPIRKQRWPPQAILVSDGWFLAHLAIGHVSFCHG
jgi:hypothetical protein